MGKASTKAQNKYIAKAYDRINLTVSKGKKEVIQAYATAQGESVNGFINRAIDQVMNTAPSETAPVTSASPPLVQGVVLSSNTVEAVRGISEVTGEALDDYVYPRGGHTGGT